MKPLLAPALLGLALAAPASLAAQDDAGDRVNMVIVYGDDACPQSTADEIIVCARQSENERFRIPPALRLSEDPDNTSWTQRVESLEMVGDFGAMSCSPVGAGGFTGCTQQMIAAAYADREGGSNVRFGQLIAEARAARLATIDEEAAAEQERVEQIEREYMERLERERAEALPGEAVPAGTREAGEEDDFPGDAPPIMDPQGK